MQLTTAAKERKLEGILATYAQERRDLVRSLIRASEKWDEAACKLMEATAERFKDDPDELSLPLEKMAEKLFEVNQNLEIIDQKSRSDGSIKLFVQGYHDQDGKKIISRQEFTAVQEDGVWKLVSFTTSDPQDAEKLRQDTLKLAGIVNALTLQVKAGKYTELADVLIDFREAAARLNKQAAPPEERASDVAATPEEALNRFAGAADARNLNGMLQACNPDLSAQLKALLAAWRSESDARTLLTSAMQSAFGKASTPPRKGVDYQSSLIEMHQNLKFVSVRHEIGGVAEIIVQSTNRGSDGKPRIELLKFLAERDESGWKLSSILDANLIERLSTAAAGRAHVLYQVVHAIQSGEITNRAEAEELLRDQLARLRRQETPGAVQPANYVETSRPKNL